MIQSTTDTNKMNYGEINKTSFFTSGIRGITGTVSRTYFNTYAMRFNAQLTQHALVRSRFSHRMLEQGSGFNPAERLSIRG